MVLAAIIVAVILLHGGGGGSAFVPQVNGETYAAGGSRQIKAAGPGAGREQGAQLDA